LAPQVLLLRSWPDSVGQQHVEHPQAVRKAPIQRVQSQAHRELIDRPEQPLEIAGLMKQPHFRQRQRVTIGGRSRVNERGALKPVEGPVLSADPHLARSLVERVPRGRRLDYEERAQHGNGSDRDRTGRMIREGNSPDGGASRLSQAFHHQDHPGE
jgi:hypothetical protein